MHSIKHKILTFALLATLIPSIGLGALLFQQYQADIDEHVRHELRNATDDARAALTVWLRERVNDVRALSTAYVLVDGLAAAAAPASGSAVGPQEIALYLRSVQRRVQPLLELTVSAPDGSIVASSAADPAVPVLPNAWRDAAVTEGFVLEPTRWDPTHGTATMTVVVPLLSSQNELVGALSAVLDLRAIEPRLRDALGGSSMQTLLLAPDGTPLLATQSAASTAAALSGESVAGLRRTATATSVTTNDGRAVVGLATAHPSMPLTVLVAGDRESAFAPWQRTLQVFGVVTACLALLVGSIGYRIGRSIAAPIDGLILAADGIARGDLNVSVDANPPGEVGRLTRTFNAMTEHLRRSSADVDAAQRSLQERNEHLEVVASIDALTGVYNRKKLDEALATEFERFLRHGRAYTVLMLDVDNFKSVNDTYGHGIGDEVLAAIARILERCVRGIDVVGRYGGEEFVVVLVETRFEAALAVAERIRSEVQRTRFSRDPATISVTLSAGVAEVQASDPLATHALRRADQALYRAKREGRNQVQLVA